MLYLAVKAALSGIIVMVVSEIARRSPTLGGLVASLPLISILGILWLWRDTHDTQRIATHAESTFWFVLPSLPMFLILPYLLRHAVNFWLALAVCCVITMLLYTATFWLLPKLGLKL